MAKLSSLLPANNTTITANSITISALVGSVQSSPCTVYLEVSEVKDFSTLFYSTNKTATTGATVSFPVSGLQAGNYYWRLKVVDGGVTSNYTTYRGIYVNILSTITGSLSPDAILVQTNLTGSLTDIQDDPDSPDANWLAATSNTSTATLRVSFPTPPANLVTGAGLQEFKVWVMRSLSSSSANPSATISLYEGGTLKTSGSATAVNSSTGMLLTYSWDAASLSAVTGANVEMYITAPVAGSGGSRTTIDVGAVEWNYQIQGVSEAQVTATTDAVPTAVDDLRSAAAVDFTRLAWATPIDSDFSHVEVYKDAALLEDYFTGTMFTDTSVSPNTSYQYKVRAFDMAGNNSIDVIENIITPSPYVAPTPEPVPSKTPVFQLISTSSPKISDEPTKNISTVKFKFDMDVTSWKVNVLGVSPDTGILIDSGNTVLKDTEITIQIDWTELQQEGVNRINIYGYNGVFWTPYDDASVVIPRKYEYGTYDFGYYSYGKL